MGKPRFIRGGCLVRKIDAIAKGFSCRTVLRTVSIQQIASQWTPELRFLVRVKSSAELKQINRLASSNIGNLALLTDSKELFNLSGIPSIYEYGEQILPGDVVAAYDDAKFAHILFRESDAHHTVFLTNRCNSNCLMCSQPPTPQNDSWLIDEAIQVANHMRMSPGLIGFTGGEPLLLGDSLKVVLTAFRDCHPETAIDLLTNGRLLSEQAFTALFPEESPKNITWMVPLYGHADFLHDFVVQSPGAFEQTLDGLLTLQNHHQPIQLRIVLIKPVLEVLPQLCAFIARNLPFVYEVALMGCEPIGFALANRDACEVDVRDWWNEIEAGIAHLHRIRLTVLLMNIPLCALPAHLHRYAHRSISDWKNAFADECKSCVANDQCTGLFAWHEKGWRPTAIRAFKGEYQ
jgi:His-Xaa-Ser system radical SAM maturase HxsC